MPSTRINPWSQENSQKTLQDLRVSYPRYSDNEIYVTWCKITGHVPFDKAGKIDQNLWQIHATEDGQFIREGGFKVSRPLYGRALKAVSGKAKPKNAARGSKTPKEEPALRLDPFTSAHAMKFATEFNRASRILDELLSTRREVQLAVDQMRKFPRGLLVILREEGTAAREAMEKHDLL